MGGSTYTFKSSPYSSHSLLLALFPEPGRGRLVLDLGCGDGHLGRVLGGRGYQVTGVERRGGVTGSFPASVRLVEADLDDGLPHFDGRFDFILCADILEHLQDPQRLVRELAGLLAPGGRLVASLPNSGNLYFRLNVLAGRFPRHDKGLFDRTHLHFFTWDGWRALLAGGGFLLESCAPTGIPVGLMFPRRETWLPVRAAESVCYGLARLWKTMFAYQFVVTARPAS